jgi:hypothetical protein
MTMITIPLSDERLAQLALVVLMRLLPPCAGFSATGIMKQVYHRRQFRSRTEARRAWKCGTFMLKP